jgi:hypothetical protein
MAKGDVDGLPLNEFLKENDSGVAALMQDRLARNEAVYRDVNEQIDSLNTLGAGMPRFPIVCECAGESCSETMLVDHAFYESVRAHSERFIVTSPHFRPEVDEVVEDHGGMLVVAKRPGRPREVAEETDARTPAPGWQIEPIEAEEVDLEMARRLAINESRFREANERIEDLAEALEADAPSVPFVCECGRTDCLDTIRIPIKVYERARQDPRYFLCKPGHEIIGPGLGRVVEETDTFVIMEKLGIAGAIAAERDPRTR